MSKMCKLSEKCTEKEGMCIHEKMMLVMMVVAVALAGHFMFGWY